MMDRSIVLVFVDDNDSIVVQRAWARAEFCGEHCGFRGWKGGELPVCRAFGSCPLEEVDNGRMKRCADCLRAEVVGRYIAREVMDEEVSDE